MGWDIILLLVGLALVVKGADYLVEGASAIARKLGLSEFVIGLTIVGMGTSAPEMVVSLIGALQGKGAIAVGNVVGSNIFNTLLILGVTALILPMDITRENRRRDIPFNLLFTLLLIGLGLNGTLFGLGNDGLMRWDGAILLTLFVLYMVMCFRKGRQEQGNEPQEENAAEEKSVSPWFSTLRVLGGLAALVFGGRFFVNSAVSLATRLGMSEKLVAITILAGGTSLPELATCVAAAVKKKGQLALGNIIGSNVFNILLILGGSALLNPLSFNQITVVDMGALLLSAIALVTCLWIGRKNQLDRLDGSLFLLVWAAYMTYLILQR